MIFSQKKNNLEFNKLIQPHMVHINQLAYRLTGNKDDAQDLVQDFLIKVFPRFDTLDQERGIKSWLSRVLYNTYIDQWRKQKNNPIQVVSDINKYDMDDETFFNEHICQRFCPAEMLNLSQQQQILIRLLFRLKNEHRIVITMHDIEGYTLPELSEILGVTLGTLKSRLHRARAKLKILIEQEKLGEVEVVA